MSRLKELYTNEIMDAMTKKFGYKNVMQVPKLDKIVINMGVGEAKENAKLLDAAIADMELITGQKAIATKAKKSVANFKIIELRRKGRGPQSCAEAGQESRAGNYKSGGADGGGFQQCAGYRRAA